MATHRADESMNRARPTGARLSRRDLLKRAALVVGAPALFGLVQACAPTAPPPAAKPTEAPKPAGAATSAPAAKPADAAKPAEAPKPAAQPTAAPAAKAGGSFKPLVATQGVDPETLDPHFGESGPMGNVLNNVFEPLVQYDRKMTIVPGLAESWQVQDDKLTWRFKLRQNVTFQNGEPFNAEAVKFTIERTMNADLRGKGLNDPFPSRSGITRVNVVDPATIELVLDKPNIILPVFLTFLYILEPKHYTSKSPQETALQPIGTGPWRVTEWIKGDHLTLQANSGYWRGDPGIPEIRFRPVPEKATRLNMLLAGEADIVGGLTPEDFPAVEGDSKLRISRAEGSRRFHLGIPTNNPRYKDRAVRQALLQAIDYDGLAKALLGPMAPQRRSNVLVAGEAWLNPKLQPVAYDPAAAKQALQAAGFSSEKVPIITPAGRYLKDKEVAQAIAGNLRAVGVNAEAEILDWTVYTDRMRAEKGIGELYLLGLGSRFNGPEDVSIVTTGQIWDQTFWVKETENGPKFEAMYKELTQTFDEQKQHELVNTMQELFVQEAVWAPLWIEPAASGVNKRITWEDFGGGNVLRFWVPGEDPTKVTA
jgi:peptide/nickel transport system substrate-binding protein